MKAERLGRRRASNRKEGRVQRRGPMSGSSLLATAFWTQATAAQRSRSPSARGAPRIGKSPRLVKKFLRIGGSRGQGNLGALAESLERVWWLCRHLYRGAIRRKEQMSMVVGIGVDANRKQRVPKFRKCGNPGEL